jgi:GT2 family glycosyltransferase
VLNYNGQQWLPRCFESLEAQTFFPNIETIIVDNNSPDGSSRLAAEWFQRGIPGKLIQNKINQYFCEGNNTGAAAATGEFLLFLNPDIWLERDCLEKLYGGVTTVGADAATPLVLDYDDDAFQSSGAPGLDLFGIPTSYSKPPANTTEIFAACGCSLLIRRDMFQKIGGFPVEFLMYGEESDLSWRVWIAGGKIVVVPEARLHHRGAVAVNPAGDTKIMESRTSETKRFLANRNGILLLMSNAQHIFLLLLLSHLTLLFLEALAALILIRRWRFVRKAYGEALLGAFRLLPQMRQRRQRSKEFRRRGDFGMLRFVRLLPSRWVEVKKIFTVGPPKVDAK